MNRRTLDQSGLTMVELLIAITVTVAVTTAILAFALSFWSTNATLQNNLETYVTRSNAGDSLRTAFNTASGLITQNSLADANTHAADPADGSGQHWELIHAIPGSTPIGASGTYTPLMYFESPALDSSKHIIFNGESPYLNEYILYLDGSAKKLLLRTLANPAASGNIAKTTCPPGSASSSCPADKTIAEDISSVETRYFSRSGNTIDYTSITDTLTGAYIGPDFPSVEVVELTLNLYRESTLDGGQDTLNSTIVRVAIRN